jgi:hypothetical protein
MKGVYLFFSTVKDNFNLKCRKKKQVIERQMSVSLLLALSTAHHFLGVQSVTNLKSSLCIAVTGKTYLITPLEQAPS